MSEVTSPIVRRAAKAVNDKMDMNRVLHGPQDGYSGFRKGATAYEPDGTVRHFVTEAEVKAYYEKLGHQTRVGQYGDAPRVPPPRTDTPDLQVVK